MKEFHCPYCGQAAFATLCSDCQAAGIRIQQTKSVFHIGRCHRCGHMDDEPCAARTGSFRTLERAWQGGSKALREFRQRAVRLASRAAETIKGGSIRT
jgi:NMD protein affecting ribosome stability and mRNA decay